MTKHILSGIIVTLSICCISLGIHKYYENLQAARRYLNLKVKLKKLVQQDRLARKELEL